MNKNFMNMMQTQEDISSDEEVNKTSTNKQRLTKKESRNETQRMRRNYGLDSGQQRNNKEGQRYQRGRGRGRGRGREKDRQSGTGRQAYGGRSQKGGYGKGNVGTMEGQIEEAQKGNVILNQDEVPAPEPVKEEKIVDLDDYMKEKGMMLSMTKKGDDQEQLKDPKMFEDENTVAISYKKKTVGENNKIKNDRDEVVLGGTVMTDKWKPQRRKRKKAKKNKLTEDDFPALS